MIIVFSCILTSEHTILQWIIPNLPLHRWPSLKSVSHKTRQKDMSVAMTLGLMVVAFLTMKYYLSREEVVNFVHSFL